MVIYPNLNLCGHANLQMATRDVQNVFKQTDRVIENSRKYVVQEKEYNKSGTVYFELIVDSF